MSFAGGSDEETNVELTDVDDAGELADTIAAALSAKVSDKQLILTEASPLKRLELVMAFMEGELSVLQVERKIRGRVKRQMEKTQREYYLNEQLKAATAITTFGLWFVGDDSRPRQPLLKSAFNE